MSEEKSVAFRNTVVSGLKWTVFARISAQVYGWIIGIVVIRYLTPDDYGLKAMSELAYSFLIMLGTMGLTTAIIQKKDLTDLHLRQIFGVLFLISSALFVIQWVLAPFIANFYHEPRVIELIRVLGLGFVLIFLSSIPGALLARDMEFKKRSIIGLISTVVGGTLTLGLAINGMGVWSLIIGALTGMALQTIGVNIIKPWFRFPSFNFVGIGGMVNFGGTVMITSILTFVYVNTDVFLAGRMLETSVVGIYAVAMHLASLPANKILPMLNQVAFPSFSKIQGDKKAVKYYFLKSVRIVSFLLFPSFVGLAFIADDLVHVVLGEKWLEIIVPLILLCVSMPLRTISMLNASVINAIGKPKVNLTNVLISLFIIVPSVFLGVQWGILGLCLAWVIAYPVAFWLVTRNVIKVLGVSFKEYYLQIIPGVASSLFMGVIVYLVSVVPIDLVATWLHLSVQIVFGAIAYFLFSRYFYKGLIAECMGILK